MLNWSEIQSQTRRMPLTQRRREFDLVLICLIEERTGDARHGRRGDHRRGIRDPGGSFPPRCNYGW
jgi:hypothetical protein